MIASMNLATQLVKKVNGHVTGESIDRDAWNKRTNVECILRGMLSPTDKDHLLHFFLVY